MYFFLKNFSLTVIILLCTSFFSTILAQQIEADLGELYIPDPPSFIEIMNMIVQVIYIIIMSRLEIIILVPIILSPEEYRKLKLKEDLKEYYKSKIDAARVRKTERMKIKI